MRRICIALAAILFTGTAAHAQEPKRMSLQDCLDYAMQHNYTVKNAQLDVLIQKAQNDQTLAIALPQVSGKADFNYFINPQKSFIDYHSFSPSVPEGTIAPIAFSLNYATSANLNASQILFDGSVAVALQARNALMELARQTGKVSEATIRYNVVKSYYSIVVTRNQLALLQKTLAYSRQMQHEFDVYYEQGMIEKIDVERSEVQINNLANDSTRITNLTTLTEQVLKYQIGMDINTPLVLTDDNLDKHVEDAARLLAMDESYVTVPEYNVTLTAIKLNEYNLKRYRMAALPTVAAFGAYGLNYGENKFSKLYANFKPYESYSLVGLQINMTLFGGMKRMSQVKETQFNIEKAKNNLENLKQSLDFMSTQAKTSLRNALLQVQSQKRNVSLAEDVLELARKKYKAGVGSNSEVTQAQTEQLRAQTNYFSTMLDIINAEADLKKALGLL